MKELLEDENVYRSIVLKMELKNENVYWIRVAKDTDQWRVLFNALMNFCLS
jgi:hypothetical protein